MAIELLPLDQQWFCAQRSRGTATSAKCNVIERAWRIAFAPDPALRDDYDRRYQLFSEPGADLRKFRSKLRDV